MAVITLLVAPSITVTVEPHLNLGMPGEHGVCRRAQVFVFTFDDKTNTTPAQETVNHPDHYNHGAIECIDVIEDWGLGFHAGNAVKYIMRSKHKGRRSEDLRKAIWYLNRLIELEENQ